MPGESTGAAEPAPDPDSDSARSTELLLELYKLLKEEIVTQTRLDNQRSLEGIAAAALVVAYAAYTGEPAIAIVIPFIFAYFQIKGYRSRMSVMFLSQHMLAIERELREEEPLFCWETAQGAHFGEGRRLVTSVPGLSNPVDLHPVPRISTWILEGMMYVGSVGGAIYVALRYLAPPVSWVAVALVLAVLVLQVASAYVTWLHDERLPDEQYLEDVRKPPEELSPGE